MKSSGVTVEICFEVELKEAACFERNWLPARVSDSFANGTPLAKQSTHRVREDTASPAESEDVTARDLLSEIPRTVAQKILRAAIENEVAD